MLKCWKLKLHQKIKSMKFAVFLRNSNKNTKKLKEKEHNITGNINNETKKLKITRNALKKAKLWETCQCWNKAKIKKKKKHKRKQKMLEKLNIKGRPRKRSKFNEIENEKVCHCQNRFDG